MEPPVCPIHNVPMELKTARRGPFRGQRFWGCPTWQVTKCKQRVPLVDDGAADDEGLPPDSSAISFPRVFRARPLFQGYQARFFQSTALPASLLDELRLGDVGPGVLRALAQWRLDFPESAQLNRLDERQCHVLAVVDKILTRGRITLLSPSLEQDLHALFGSPETDFDGDLQLLFRILTYQPEYADVWMDSPPERVFYRQVLLEEFGLDLAHWTTPQADVASLLGSDSDISEAGRVDFLISHPLIPTPIVVEIDGKIAHQAHAARDAHRDELLQEKGYVVFRIPAAEIEAMRGQKLDALRALLQEASIGLEDEPIPTPGFGSYAWACRISHQIQLAVLQALKSGFLPLSGSWCISSDFDECSHLAQLEAEHVLERAVRDLVELISHTSALYGADLPLEAPICLVNSPVVPDRQPDIHISFIGRTQHSAPVFNIRDIHLPFDVASESFPSTPATIDDPDAQIVKYFLNYIFRKEDFWEGQFDAIRRALQGKDAILLLPTGAGKSIAFQLASFLLPGRTIVIDPIISLIDDQIDNLAGYGIDRCIGITSQILKAEDRSRAMSLFGQGEYIFAYVAPERLQTVEFRESLRSLTVHTPVALVAIDEAHCISEWGHDFRTAYLNIGRTSRKYCESGGVTPPLLALTGTASRAVLKDIQRELQIEDFDAIITPKSFDRPELQFRIISCSSAEKMSRLTGYLGQLLPGLFRVSSSRFYETRGKETLSGLVFCPHVNGSFGVVQVAETLRTQAGVPCNFYSGKQPKYWSPFSWNIAKKSVAAQFKHNRVPLLVATKAYGMGIDKPNIRYTIHYGLPQSIESFYQEAGRAARDRKTAYCCVIVSDDDKERSDLLLSPSTSVTQIAEVLAATSWDEADDITRALFFHTNAFQGADVELDLVQQVLNQLGQINRREVKNIAFEAMDRKSVEKSLHRLLLIGLVNDYTINYASEEFTVHLSGASKGKMVEAYGAYVAGYLGSRQQTELDKARRLLDLPFDQFVVQLVRLLIHFIYDIIERGRRRALQEMRLAAEVDPTDQGIRQRILRYLEATEYSSDIDNILAQSDVGFEQAISLFELVRSPNEAAELRGQVSRYLESYPDHPSLLMLRALAEAFSRDTDTTVIKQNLLASVSSAFSNYGVDRPRMYAFVGWSLSQIGSRSPKLSSTIQEDLLRQLPDPELARTFLRHLPANQAAVPAWFLLHGIATKAKALVS